VENLTLDFLGKEVVVSRWSMALLEEEKINDIQTITIVI